MTWVDGRNGVDADIFALQVLAAATADPCLNTPDPLPAEVDGGVRVSRNGSDAVITWDVAARATASGSFAGT